jgi:hypothetical protein
VEAYTKNDHLVYRFAIPGVDAKDVDISTANNRLTVKVERKAPTDVKEGDWHFQSFSYGKFEHAVSLPRGTDVDGVSATFKNGVLEVAVPLPKAILPKKIEVKELADQQLNVCHERGRTEVLPRYFTRTAPLPGRDIPARGNQPCEASSAWWRWRNSIPQCSYHRPTTAINWRLEHCGRISAIQRAAGSIACRNFNAAFPRHPAGFAGLLPGAGECAECLHRFVSNRTVSPG